MPVFDPMDKAVELLRTVTKGYPTYLNSDVTTVQWEGKISSLFHPFDWLFNRASFIHNSKTAYYEGQFSIIDVYKTRDPDDYKSIVNICAKYENSFKPIYVYYCSKSLKENIYLLQKGSKISLKGSLQVSSFTLKVQLKSGETKSIKMVCGDSTSYRSYIYSYELKEAEIIELESITLNMAPYS